MRREQWCREAENSGAERLRTVVEKRLKTVVEKRLKQWWERLKTVVGERLPPW